MNTVQSPPVKRLVERLESEKNLPFRPTLQTFKAMGINRIRFGQFIRGQKEPSISEAKLIATFFSNFFPCSPGDLLD